MKAFQLPQKQSDVNKRLKAGKERRKLPW